MDKADIKPQCTYQCGHTLYYVQDIVCQRVIFNRVGDVERREMPLGRFAALADQQTPNQ